MLYVDLCKLLSAPSSTGDWTHALPSDLLCRLIPTQVCVGQKDLDCMDVEIKDDRPTPKSPRVPLPDTSNREMCFENAVVRAYRVKVAPGQPISGGEADSSSQTLQSLIEFPCLIVAMADAKLSTKGAVKAGDRWWHEPAAGDCQPEERETNEGVQEAEMMILEPM